VKRSRESMAETTLPHWTIGAALALVATAVAAEPMGEATRHVINQYISKHTFLDMTTRI